MGREGQREEGCSVYMWILILYFGRKSYAILCAVESVGIENKNDIIQRFYDMAMKG
jgi:hypothetical protein